MSIFAWPAAEAWGQELRVAALSVGLHARLRVIDSEAVAAPSEDAAPAKILVGGGASSLAIARRCRERAPGSLIIIGEAATSVELRARCASVGGDDCVDRSETDVVIAHVRSHFRKQSGFLPKLWSAGGQAAHALGVVRFDFDQQALRLGDASIRLTRTELAVLKVFGGARG